MSRTLTYYPPRGLAPITAGYDGDFGLRHAMGLSENLAEVHTVRAPGQHGESAVDILSRGRVVRAALTSRSGDDIDQRRRQLAAALATVPVRRGEVLELGTLRVERPTPHVVLELPALPHNSPQETLMEGGQAAIFDIEWRCPYPFWMETADSFQLLKASGGFQFSVQFPLEMATSNIQVEIDNAGDVDAPVLARLYGDVTTARIRNLTTGEDLEITGQILTDQYVEIDTAFGAKKIDLVTISTGARVSIFNRLNLAKADFWQLRPGVNVVRFEADTNVSGQATVHWRQRYAGI